MAKKKLYRTVIELEVLSEEPVGDGRTMGDIDYEINEGSWSGIYRTMIQDEVVVGKKAADLTIEQGSDPEFFMMDEDGNEIEE